SPYTSLVDMGRSLVGPLAPVLVPDRFDNLSKIEALKCPIVIVHGTRDEVVPFEMGRRLAAAGRNVRFIPLEGRTHNDLPELPRLLAEEIRRALGPG
ncbi:MAG: alpha/beta hydrolase, partial [Thermoanaerobaculia bacterium]